MTSDAEREPAVVMDRVVKRYGDIGPGIEAAVAGYAKDVRARVFPGPDQVYGMKKK